jgi:chromosome segregation ATPase
LGGRASRLDHVSEFDALVEGLGDALGWTRFELCRDWEAANRKLLDQIHDLKGELNTLTKSYQNTQTRVTQLERQLATVTQTRIANLERNVKVLIGAQPDKSARLSVVENQVKALNATIGGEPSARELDSRIGYIEALMSTVFPTPSRSRA